MVNVRDVCKSECYASYYNGFYRHFSMSPEERTLQATLKKKFLIKGRVLTVYTDCVICVVLFYGLSIALPLDDMDFQRLVRNGNERCRVYKYRVGLECCILEKLLYITCTSLSNLKVNTIHSVF